MIKDIIALKTCLIPNIIAEHSIWDYLEKEHPELTPEQCKDIELFAVPLLEDKANTLYQTNVCFKKGITSSMKGRDRLAMWFCHWAAPIVRQYFEQNKKVVLTVVKDSKRGYQLQHNQPKGWKGTTSNRFHWYKFKKDANDAAIHLMKFYNTPTDNSPY